MQQSLIEGPGAAAAAAGAPAPSFGHGPHAGLSWQASEGVAAPGDALYPAHGGHMGEGGKYDEGQTVLMHSDGGAVGGGGGHQGSVGELLHHPHHPMQAHAGKLESGAGAGGHHAGLQQHLNAHRPEGMLLGATAGDGPTDHMDTASSCSGSDAGHPLGGVHPSSLGSTGGYVHMAHYSKDFDSTGGSSSGVSPSNGGSEGGGGGGTKGFKKRAWVTSEDNLLKQLVETHGPKDWNFISAQLTGRSAKQCCERWHNYLKPNIRKDAWRPEEDKLILDYHHSFCNKWSKIAEYLPGRTGNAVKNRYYCLMRRDRKAGGPGASSGGGTPTAMAVNAGAPPPPGGPPLPPPHHDGVIQIHAAAAHRPQAYGAPFVVHQGGSSDPHRPDDGGAAGGQGQQGQGQQGQGQPLPPQQQQQQGGEGNGGEQQQQQQQGGFQPAFPQSETIHYTWTANGWAATTASGQPLPPTLPPPPPPPPPPGSVFFAAAPGGTHPHGASAPQQLIYAAAGPDGAPAYLTAAPSDGSGGSGGGGNGSAGNGAPTAVVLGGPAFFHAPPPPHAHGHAHGAPQPIFAVAPQDIRFSEAPRTITLSAAPAAAVMEASELLPPSGSLSSSSTGTASDATAAGAAGGSRAAAGAAGEEGSEVAAAATTAH